MQLKKKYADLDDEFKKKKQELSNKIAPFIREFIQDTGILINYIKPDYIEVTEMGQDMEKFVIWTINIDTKI